MMQMQKKLETIFEHQVFELCGPFEEHGSTCYYVPYMMNDAVENYLVLRDCRLVGKFQPDFHKKFKILWVQKPSKKAPKKAQSGEKFDN